MPVLYIFLMDQCKGKVRAQENQSQQKYLLFESTEKLLIQEKSCKIPNIVADNRKILLKLRQIGLDSGFVIKETCLLLVPALFPGTFRAASRPPPGTPSL